MYPDKSTKISTLDLYYFSKNIGFQFETLNILDVISLFSLLNLKLIRQKPLRFQRMSNTSLLYYHVFNIICIILYNMTKVSYFVRMTKTTVNIKEDTY